VVTGHRSARRPPAQQQRLLRAAPVGADRAAWVEAAARRWGDGAGHVAGQHRAGWAGADLD
jgi:hypothetical protein